MGVRINKGLPEYQFKDYLDIAGMPTPGDNDKVVDTAVEQGGAGDISTWTPAVIQDLIRINTDQKKQLDDIIDRMTSLTSVVEASPVMVPVKPKSF